MSLIVLLNTKALSCEVRDMHVIVRRKVIRGFRTIPNRAAVKFTEKDNGVLQTSKTKYVCCG